MLYWLVSGDVIRGTGHKRLADFDAALRLFDGIVERCVRQDAKGRFQTGKEVMDALTGAAKAQKEGLADHRLIETLRKFERLLAECAPGKYGVIELRSEDQIDHVMTTLAKGVPGDLWWTRGYSNIDIQRIAKEGAYWLVNAFELLGMTPASSQARTGQPWWRMRTAPPLPLRSPSSGW
jgi:hypothetical protein